MKTIYQIVVKGMASNQIKVYDFETYKLYSSTLDALLKSKRFLVITTNQFTL